MWNLCQLTQLPAPLPGIPHVQVIPSLVYIPLSVLRSVTAGTHVETVVWLETRTWVSVMPSQCVLNFTINTAAKCIHIIFKCVSFLRGGLLVKSTHVYLLTIKFLSFLCCRISCYFKAHDWFFAQCSHFIVYHSLIVIHFLLMTCFRVCVSMAVLFGHVCGAADAVYCVFLQTVTVHMFLIINSVCIRLLYTACAIIIIY